MNVNTIKCYPITTAWTLTCLVILFLLLGAE
jgi:hypothetical protein